MRGRKAKELEGMDSYNFKQLARTKGSARERRRYLAFAHIQREKVLGKQQKQ